MNAGAIITAVGCIAGALFFFYLMTQFDVRTAWYHKVWIAACFVLQTMGALIQFRFGFHG